MFFANLTEAHKKKLLSVLTKMNDGITQFTQQTNKNLEHFVSEPLRSLTKIYKCYTKMSPNKTSSEEFNDERLNWSEHLRIVTIEYQCEQLVLILENTPDLSQNPRMSRIISSEISRHLETIFEMFQNPYKKRPAGRTPKEKVWDVGLGKWVEPSPEDVSDNISEISEVSELSEIHQVPYLSEFSNIDNPTPKNQKIQETQENDWESWTNQLAVDISYEGIF
jgi:hypothetical protein